MPRYSRSSGHGKTICPICHSEGYLEETCTVYEGSAETVEYCYWRVIHYYKGPDGKRHKVVHYFGPVGREYWRVEPIHKLGLRDLESQDPTIIARKLVYNLVDVARALKHTRHAKRYLQHVKKLKEYLSKEALPLLEELERELEEAIEQAREI
jgi:hypothetical protein